MTVVAASLSLLLHVLPPYRPLIHRVRSAESIALVEITRQTRQQLAFEPKMSLHGEALKSARIQPGHKPSAKAPSTSNSEDAKAWAKAKAAELKAKRSR